MDCCHTFKGQPEWTNDFVQSEKKDMSKSTDSLPATRIQVPDNESQVSQIESVLEKQQLVRIEEEEEEEEEDEISLVSDTVTQDTEMSEPRTYLFVRIKNLDSHMKNREQFLRRLLNPFVKVLLVQIFQE